MPGHGRLPAVHSQVKNRILLALPEHEFQRILTHLEYVGLSLGRVLYNADNWIDYAYFMNSGMSSLLAVTADGETVEIGTVGSEGVMGVQAALGKDGIFYSGVVQIPGNAMRIRSDALRYEFQHNAGLSRLLLDYMLDLHLQADQSEVCRRVHSPEQRLCRWLLTSHDCSRSKRLPITHDFLSRLLVAPRATVALAVEALKETGLISYRRGLITIVDRQGLEARTCECYRIVTDKYERLSAA